MRPAADPRRIPNLRPIAGALGLVVVLSLALFEGLTWGRIAYGVSALGASLGGLSQQEAAARLTSRAQAVADRPLTIQAPGHSWTTSPHQLGIGLDVAALVQSAYDVGRQGNPAERLAAQVGALAHGRAIAPPTSRAGVASGSSASLDSSLQQFAQALNRAPVDAHLALSASGQIGYTPAQEGLAVDLAASQQRIFDALANGSPTVDLAVHQVPPSVTDAQVQAAHDQLVRLFGAGGNGGAGGNPLTLSFADQQYQLSAADVLGMLTLQPPAQAGQAATLTVQDAPLKAYVAKLASKIDQKVQDARFQFSGGSLRVLRPSAEGRQLDTAATEQLIRTSLLNGTHTAALPVNVVKPAVSSDNPQSLGITHLIASSSTSFAGSVPDRAWNIKLATKRLNGVVVPPGGTFSFNKEVGPTTLAAGFRWGYGIEASGDGAKTVPSVAGGICQVATTLFHPVFWAGYEVEERYQHLYWIPEYISRGMVGLDVTVDEDANLDFQWKNTTSNAVLVQAATDSDHVYFSLYGKEPSWKVDVSPAQITNRRSPSPQPVVSPEPKLPWGQTVLVESARDGFDVTVTRTVTPADGSTPRVLKLHSSYQPTQTMTLVGTGGAPASANVNAVVEQVLARQTAELLPKPKATAAAASPTAAATASTAKRAATAAPTAKAAAPTSAPAAHPTTAPTPKATVAPDHSAAAPTPAPTSKAG